MLRVFVFLSISALCAASDWSSLYDKDKLQAEQQRLQTAIDFLTQNEIRPFIPPQQATTFGLQPIDLPIEGLRSDPLDFYAQNSHIVLPVRTLLFIEDLSRAYGWLWANRASTKTVDEYLCMLRYRTPSDFQEHRYPSPRTALHIPEDALSNPKVVEASLNLRRTAYSFMLLHQFAHLQLHHSISQGRGYSEVQEEEADNYALNIMKENSVTPTGILLILYSSMFFETGSGTSFHPVTPHRLEATAHFLSGRITEFVRGRHDRAAAIDGIHSIANLLVEGSEWLAVRTHQQELQQLAMKTDPSTLQPRPLPHTTK